MVSGSVDGTLRLWDAPKGECLRVLTAASPTPPLMGHVAALTACPSRTGSPPPGEATPTRPDCVCDMPVFCVASTGGDRIVSGSSDGALRVWDLGEAACEQG